MAWNAGDNDKLLSALGYPVTTDAIGEVQLMMDALQSSAPDTVTRVQTYLTALASIETQIATARNATSGVLGQLRGEGRRFTNLTSIATGLKQRNDIYSQ
jgi:hypothetical protein